MGSRGRALRASLVAVFFMSFIWYLLVGVLANRVTKTTTVKIQSTAKSELLKLLGTERHAVPWGLDLNYVSKRRVPTGPDPIHNRRAAGKFREPPGRV